MNNVLKYAGLLLLLIGFGLGGLGLYLGYLNSIHNECVEYSSGALMKTKVAHAAIGTAQEEKLKSEAGDATAGAKTICEIANRTKQNGIWAAVSALALTAVSIVLLFFSRRISNSRLN
jgi:hypothetical protein